MTFYERAAELVSKMTLDEKIGQLSNVAPAIERLGVPAYDWWNECLHGAAREGTATVFPQAISMAACFNTDLVEQVGVATSDEARAKYNEYRKFGYTLIYQGLTECAPNINIFRDPRWGRGQETYGEDPYLTGRMGTAFIKGLQGNGKHRKLDATLKHFAVHSGPEALRHGFNAVVSEKDLEETYLYAFKYCIDHADPSAIMGAYNAVNGEPASGSKWLLVDVLKNKWGFKGYMVSDDGSIADINLGHHYTKDETESAALALKCGCQMNIGFSYAYLKEAYERGLVTEEDITKAAEKLFEARFRLGMFDDDCEYNDIPYDVIECEKHRKLNLKIAEESTVLLKNDGILPLKEGITVAVIGPMADDSTVLLGNYNGTPSMYTTILRGMHESKSCKVLYARGSNALITQLRTKEHPINEAIIAARKADVVLLCLGINPSMEGEENAAPNSADHGDRITLDLPAPQLELANIILAEGKPTVLVNTSGSCINLDFAKGKCNAVIQSFYPGAEGGHAIANILFGKTSPSGRLPVTFYRSVDDLPPFEDYSMKGRTYKFFEGEPVFEFGHGLTYSDIREEWKDSYTVLVKNNGPYDTAYSVLRYDRLPYKSLADFKKIYLKVGESQLVEFDKSEG